MKYSDGVFRDENGEKFFPLGIFGNYFDIAYTGDALAFESHHGRNKVEFQRCTISVWQKFFSFLVRDGINTIRLFPRGDSGGSSWEGLDIGGRVNLDLLDKLLSFAACARSFGIRCILGLFTQPECSVYCRKDTRVYWGQRLFGERKPEDYSPSVRRFLESADDLVSYDQFFSDPDVRICCHEFLDEIIPLIRDNPDLLCVELYNEMGWASPNADPMNTFRWEHTRDYLDWGRDMTEHIHRLAPEMCVCISNPGVGLLGHDPVQWSREIGPDLYLFHNYPDICGAQPGMDYAAMSDLCLAYTRAAVPTMMGEWQVLHHNDPEEEPYLRLCARDYAWFSLLSGAPGCIAWLARSYGAYQTVHRLLERLPDGLPEKACSGRVISIASAQASFEHLAGHGEHDCVLPDHIWCPDRAATDGLHRFCHKAVSDAHKKMQEIERMSLETGADFRFSLTEGKPLMEGSREDFSSDSLIETPDGYHQKVYFSKDGQLFLGYLRNYAPLPMMKTDKNGQPYEEFCLRTQALREVFLKPADSSYDYTLFDLDDERFMPLPPEGVDLDVTSHDFVVIGVKKA